MNTPLHEIWNGWSGRLPLASLVWDAAEKWCRPPCRGNCWMRCTTALRRINTSAWPSVPVWTGNQVSNTMCITHKGLYAKWQSQTDLRTRLELHVDAKQRFFQKGRSTSEVNRYRWTQSSGYADENSKPYLGYTRYVLLYRIQTRSPPDLSST